MPVRLSVNAHETWIETMCPLRKALNDFAVEQYQEIRLAKDPEPRLCALLNSDRRWRMLMRAVEEGLRSTNPDFSGNPEALMRSRLSNGQIDEYPECWAIPESVILRDLEFHRPRRDCAFRCLA